MTVSTQLCVSTRQVRPAPIERRLHFSSQCELACDRTQLIVHLLEHDTRPCLTFVPNVT